MVFGEGGGEGGSVVLLREIDSQLDRQEVGKGSNAVKRGPKCGITLQ